MGLQFFADQCVPTVVIQDLCNAGHEMLFSSWFTSKYVVV